MENSRGHGLATAADIVDHKLHTCHRARIGYYWVAEPIGEILTVYRWHEAGYVLVLSATPDNIVRAEPFDAIELDINDIFGLQSPER